MFCTQLPPPMQEEEDAAGDDDTDVDDHQDQSAGIDTARQAEGDCHTILPVNISALCCPSIAIYAVLQLKPFA